MKKTIRDYDLKGKRVIITSDLNVPFEEGFISDFYRIEKSLPTIKYAIKEGAKVILLSHLGRIKSEEDKKKKSLKPVAEVISTKINKEVKFVSETRGKEVEATIAEMQDGDIVMLENTRFEDFPDRKESENAEDLGKYWASLGDIFINDAYGIAHRLHASNVGIASNLSNGIGFLLEEELKVMKELTTEPKRPYLVIIGGAKAKDKLGVIKSIIEKADKMLIVGGIAYTFLKALGYNIGKSICDDDSIPEIKEIIAKYKEKIILPTDHRVASIPIDGVNYRETSINDIKENEMGLDIGSESIEKAKKIIAESKTIIWSGPAGLSEYDIFAVGTNELSLALAKNKDAITVVGGGDSVAAVKRSGVFDKLTHISTGGGATLALLEGKKLPGVEIIKDK